MRFSTISYGLMTLSIGSLTIYGIAHADELRNPFGEAHAFAANAAAECQPTIILPPVTEKSAAASTEIVVAAAPTPMVTPGMSADEIRTIVGEPDGISPDGTHWTYGSSVLIFNDSDVLAGHVAFDPVQAALNKYNHMIALTQPTDDAAPSTASAKKSGAKFLTAKNSKSVKKGDKFYYRPVAAGSARNAYRFDGNNNEYSYYMNRSGPMNRMFSRKSAMPRGMMSATDRMLGRGYRSGGGTSNYNSLNSNFFRR